MILGNSFESTALIEYCHAKHEDISLSGFLSGPPRSLLGIMYCSYLGGISLKGHC